MHVQLQAAHQGMAQEAGQLAKIFCTVCRSVCEKSGRVLRRNKAYRHKSGGRRRHQGYVHQHHSLLHELLLLVVTLI